MLLTYLWASCRLFGQAVDSRLQTREGVTEKAQVSMVSTASTSSLAVIDTLQALSTGETLVSHSRAEQ